MRVGIPVAGLTAGLFCAMGILKRINEIDQNFGSTEPWLHSTLSKLAREREERLWHSLTRNLGRA